MQQPTPYKKALMLTMAATLSVSLFSSAVTARGEAANYYGARSDKAANYYGAEKSQRFGTAADYRPATIDKGRANQYRPSTVGKVHTPAATAAATTSAVGVSEITEESPTPTPQVTPTPNPKKQVCERILNRSTKLTTRIAHAETVISGITGRLTDYYTNTLVPADITIDNYDALIAAIAAKQQALETATETAGTNAKNVACDAPRKEAMLAFNADMKAVNAAAKAYRASVQALLAAIAQAAASLETPSPSPSADPEVSPLPGTSPTPDATVSPEPSPTPETSPII